MATAKKYQPIVYIRPDKPVKFAPVLADNLEDAWRTFRLATSSINAITEGGGKSRAAVVSFKGLNNRVWHRKVVMEDYK